MSRSSKKEDDLSISVDSSQFEPADNALAEKLGLAFENLIVKQYGYAKAPKPYMTPFGIQHLDALLGGGIVSSAPIMLSSTPETGKSTLAFQFSSIFQKLYPNSMIVYLDIEGSGNSSNFETGMSRVQIFGIDEKRFRYEPILVDIPVLFTLIENLANIKSMFEEKLQKEFKVLFIWDSIAATPSSKVESSDDPNRTIGVKARQLSFCLEKYGPILAHKRITFMAIDQVRANLVIDPYAQKEKTIGMWKDYRAATSIQALNHRVAQWLFLSKKAQITPDDGLGINGWFMSLYTEKNKSAPSQEAVMCVFDKRNGLHKFWSEYTFLSEMTPSEKKYYKDENKLLYPLSIKKAGSYVYLEFIDPTTGSVQYTSDKFYRKDAHKLYTTSEQFRQAFDYVMTVAVDYRIKQGLFQLKNSLGEIRITGTEKVDGIDEFIEDSTNSVDQIDKDEFIEDTINSVDQIDKDEVYQSVF